MKTYKVISGNKFFELSFDNNNGLLVNGKQAGIEYSIDSKTGIFRIRYENKLYEVYPKLTPAMNFDVWVNQHVIPVSIEDPQEQLLAQFQKSSGVNHSRFDVRAPMPGLVISINVSVGQEINKNDRLISLEAMKMENEIRSPIKGKITKIEVEKNSKVEKEQKLITIEAI